MTNSSTSEADVQDIEPANARRRDAGEGRSWRMVAAGGLPGRREKRWRWTLAMAMQRENRVESAKTSGVGP
jgi:hypothetical protein